MSKFWAFNPHAGGKKIPDGIKLETQARIEAHAAEHFAGLYRRIDVRFRGQFCYIDAFVDDDVSPGMDPVQAERIRNTPMQLCRIRFFGEDRWSLAFFKYSDMKYEPCFFDTGEWIGTPEQALDVGGVYLR